MDDWVENVEEDKRPGFMCLIFDEGRALNLN